MAEKHLAFVAAATPATPQIFLSLKDFEETLEKVEEETMTKYIVSRKDPVFGEDNVQPSPEKVTHWELKGVHCDGVPFQLVGSKVYGCHQGRDKSLQQKKDQILKEKQALDDHTIKSRLHLIQPTKKMNCPAKLTVTQIIKFPDFKVEEKTEDKRQKASADLKKAVAANSSAAKGVVEYHTRFPAINEHQYHPDVGQVDYVAADLVTLELLLEAWETVQSSPLGVIHTPMIPWCQTTLPVNIMSNIYIKLENMQRTGSFKIRGVANQFAKRLKGGYFVTMSAGNYGKSFAYALKHYGSKGKVVMPETAPMSRATLIQSFGVEVERVQTSCLMNAVNRCVQEDNMTFLHSYDDLDLIAGHASLGLEILEQIPKPDVVVVCCGGGGLLAGVAAAIKLSGCDKTRVYGVEPEGACTMYRSFIEEKPVGMDTKSIASGLAPPFAGKLPYELCQRFVEEIILVSDEEITAAVSILYGSGLVVEPSGCAAFAAIINHKVPNLEGNVVCVLSGGNIGKDELGNFPD